MVTNYRFLREHILYHLNLGIDKFFLYNNDREYNTPAFYLDYRRVGDLNSLCFNATLEEQYAVIQNIW